MSKIKCQDEFGQEDHRRGERRTHAMPECEQYVRFPHPKCIDIATLETEVRSNKAEREKEFAGFKEFVKDKFHDVNQLRQDVISDRSIFFTKKEHEYFAESVNKDIKEIKKIQERNSDRLTNLENLSAKKKELDDAIANLKLFHEADLKLVSKFMGDMDKLDLQKVKIQTEGFTRLVYIGIGIAIAAQIVIHFYFLNPKVP